MDKSFLWRNELPRTLNKDEVSVNAYTRRLLYTRPLITASFGNFSIPLSISFNSHYQENDYSDFTTDWRTCAYPVWSQLACRRIHKHRPQDRTQRIRHRTYNCRYRYFCPGNGGKLHISFSG